MTSKLNKLEPALILKVLIIRPSDFGFSEDGSRDEPRPLGLAMIPGRHIVTMHLDQLQHVRPDQVT